MILRRSGEWRRPFRAAFLALALCAAKLSCAAVVTGDVSIDAHAGLSAARLAVIVNDSDAYSVATAEYYAARRHVPPRNIIHVRFSSASDTMGVAEFETIRAQVTSATPTNVQAYALTWTTPYRVDCMSITAAFAFGFSADYCATGCHTTRKSMYFNSPTRLPADTLGIFPTMSIAASSIEQAKRLIDRGIAADHSRPRGTAYLVSTDDSARNVRAQHFIDAQRAISVDTFAIAAVGADAMRHRNDVMFYFTGARFVGDLETNRYLPGAVADHLTSTGGDLLHSRQMSILHWIDAGVTGSYGTVVEPCAFEEKFPRPETLLRFYLAGETLLEAYWKSVVMPGQGIFIGEPLSRPFAPSDVR